MFPSAQTYRFMGIVRAPFSATQNLEPCRIDGQVDRSVVNSGPRRHRSDWVTA